MNYFVNSLVSDSVNYRRSDWMSKIIIYKLVNKRKDEDTANLFIYLFIYQLVNLWLTFDGWSKTWWSIEHWYVDLWPTNLWPSNLWPLRCHGSVLLPKANCWLRQHPAADVIRCQTLERRVNSPDLTSDLSADLCDPGSKGDYDGRAYYYVTGLRFESYDQILTNII